MAHAIWSGSISFGLVGIPVKLFTAVKEGEGVHFNLLHARDQGRIKNLRKCSECGEEVPWDQVVRGYEVDQGRYVVVSEEELAGYRPEVTQAIDIVEFVAMTEIDPMLFDRPYYIEPEKKGRKAYALLREALQESGKVGIARIVLRTREYLAAVRPSGNALVLEMMHFESEIVKPEAFDLPPAKEKAAAREMKAAHMLIDAMAKDFDATEFHDKYRAELKQMLEARAAGAPPPKAKRKAAASNVVDLMEVLERSLRASKAGPGVHAAGGEAKKSGASSGVRKKAATTSAPARAARRRAS